MRTIYWQPGVANPSSYRSWRGVGIAAQPTAGFEDSTIDGNLYVATCTEVAQILAEAGGAVELVIDASAAGSLPGGTNGTAVLTCPLVPPVGAMFSVRGVTPSTIVDLAGFALGPVAALTDLTIKAITPAAGGLLSLAAAAVLTYVTLALKASSLGPLVQLGDMTATSVSAVGLSLDNSLASMKAVVKLGSAAGSTHGATLNLSASMGLTVATNAIQSQSTASVLAVSYDSATPAGYVRSNITLTGGTITETPLSTALGSTYAPAVLANWSGTTPTSVANALDRIAAKITPITLEGGIRC